MLKKLLLSTLSIAVLISAQSDDRIFIRQFTSPTLDSAHCATLTDFFAAELKAVTNWDIVTYHDMLSMIDQEMDKELMDCEKESCMQEIAGMLGAPFIVKGDIGKLGSYHILNISLNNIIEGSSVAKVTCKAKSFDGIIDKVDDLASDLSGVEYRPVKLEQELSNTELIIKPAHYGMKKISGGTFERGENGDEKKRTITVSGFWMDSIEVTQAEFQRLMGSNPSNFKGSDRPVEKVTWLDAAKYCNARSREAGLTEVYDEISGAVNWKAKGFRLPTEAEWEYAARAGTTTPYYWGESEMRACIYMNGADLTLTRNKPSWWQDDWTTLGCNDGYGRTSPVATYRPNRFGLYDMSGNVWEWCNDWYDENYYVVSPSKNPRGGAIGSYRVLRGGGWYYEPHYSESATRYKRAPDNRYFDLGFRVLLPE